MFTRSTLNANLLTLLMLLSSGMVMANNTALVSGAWETGTNWSSGAAPLATDIVNIPAGLVMTVSAAGDACVSLTIAATGSVIINSGGNLSIGGNFSNAGTFLASAGSTLTFNGSSNSTITGGGTYTIAGTIVMNMGSTATALDVQDTKFITGINTGANYYFSFIRGTWKMDNTATLNDSYNSGSNGALTIPFGVIVESDAGTMNLCQNAPTGSALLSGELFLNGGIVNVQTGQGFNSGQDFQYFVNGGTPQLYIFSGTLNVGAGLNALGANSYIDFHMTGGTMILALNGYSNWITFQLANVVGGKTFMSGGLIILQDACNANIEDLDMGGANVAATQYSVTGGTVQLGYTSTQGGATFFGINAEPATNYPNIDFEAGVAKTGSAFVGGNINMLSLNVIASMTFDASGFPNVNITSNNGSFAFDDEGGFIQSANNVTFSGSVPQVIKSTALATEQFYNLTIANTSGNVILGVGTTVSHQLNFTTGLIDASNFSLLIAVGSVGITGASATNYVITGNGVAGAGTLIIGNIPASTNTLFPVCTPTYYLPATINPGVNTGNSYSAYVYQGITNNGLANGPVFSPANKQNVLNAVWNIKRLAGAGTSTLSLGWSSSGTALEGSSFQGFGLNIGIMPFSAGAWQSGTGTGSVAAATATSAFSSFAQFGVVGNGVILPLILTKFAAELDNDHSVLLSWTATEGVDISYFDVQKSTDGLSWNSIGKVQSDRTSAGEQSYSLTDGNPAHGVNYYRLLVQNLDGSYTYSFIRTINLSSSTAISVFPNPANHFINVSLGDAGSNMTIRMFNPAGQLLLSSEANNSGNNGNAITTINTGNYPAGMYLVQVIAGEKIVKTSLVMITH
jgi:hypothetical protein